jgi:hypothetical protein
MAWIILFGVPIVIVLAALAGAFLLVLNRQQTVQRPDIFTRPTDDRTPKQTLGYPADP